jgi:putative DNA primase/helicase
MPIIRGTDYAMWRRVRLIPFEAMFDEETAERDLPEKLASEKPGILAWIVGGAVEWYRSGLQDPPEVLAATEGYRREMDTLGDFIEEECVTGDDRYTVSAADLYAGYSAWLRKASGGEALTKTAFGRELTRRGMAPYQASGGRRAWRGIALRAPSEGVTVAR